MSIHNCYICNAWIRQELRGDILREPMQWLALSARTGICTTETLKGHVFSNPTEWTTLCRAVYKPNVPGLNGRFKISGVFQPYQWMDDNYLYLPNDVDFVFAGSPPLGYNNLTPVFRTSIFPSTDPKGHTSRYITLIHERCLNLISQVLGSPALSQNLDQFITSLDMVERDLGIGELPWPEAAKRLNAHLEYQKKQKALGAFMHLDPWRNFELENAISHAHYSRKSGREIEMYSAPVPSATPLALPMDIQMLIIDRLDQPTDVHNAMVAFGWSFPDVYWKGRIPKDIIFEYELIYSVEIDWLAFFHWVHAMLPVSHGLRKRQFIINILELVKPVYDREVEAKMLAY